ncbi:hypothetical protein C5167_035135 [Papaver somniferum]|uniref:Uncharacterized protein n=1 Tax=Papaver somniferum TaxID=3469 RepID=A0A4Y7KIK0_PAPSO|nr:hypothetical protein C5167_035135 [Papaver somniferum]
MKESSYCRPLQQRKSIAVDEVGCSFKAAEGFLKNQQDMEYERIKGQPHQPLYSKKFNTEKSIYMPAFLFLVLVVVFKIYPPDSLPRGRYLTI